MNNNIVLGVMVGAMILGVLSIYFVVELVDMGTTTITVHEVEPGIKCATMFTRHGAAIDCWKI